MSETSSYNSNANTPSERGVLSRILHIAYREVGLMRKNPIYGFCTIIFPALAILFFTSLMDEGMPVEMPVGVVDQDNTTTSRQLIRQLDAFQTTHVVAITPTSTKPDKTYSATRSTLSCTYQKAPRQA